MNTKKSPANLRTQVAGLNKTQNLTLSSIVIVPQSVLRYNPATFFHMEQGTAFIHTGTAKPPLVADNNYFLVALENGAHL